MVTKYWKNTFNYQGKEIPYNRIKFNNPTERAVEVPIAFDFLANLEKRSRILEVGNVLSNYENSLSQVLGINSRKIIDKFEVDLSVDNEDLMNLPTEKNYDAIVSVSTVEHIGQGVDPSLDYGESIEIRDLEAPLKAIVKIYELLAINGKALITTPFGNLTDAGWYIQFSQDYLQLVVEKFGIPQDAISRSFFKLIDQETQENNFKTLWVESELYEVRNSEYNSPFNGANAIVVIEMTKVSEQFSADIDLAPTPLFYNKPFLARSTKQPLKSNQIDEKIFLQETEMLDEEDFLYAVYRSYLGREPDEGGKQTFLNGLCNNNLTREEAIANIRNSLEFQSQWSFLSVSSAETVIEIVSIDIPKTTGEKFREILEQVYGLEQIFLDYPNLPLEKKGSLASHHQVIHGDFPVKKYADYLYRYAGRIIWLKHPIIRLISAYGDRLQKNQNPSPSSLLEFAENPENQNIISSYIEGIKLTNFYFVGIAEFFREDLIELLNILGWSEFKLDLTPEKSPGIEPAFIQQILADKQLMKKLLKLNEQDLENYQKALEIRANRQKIARGVPQFQNYLEKYQSRLEKMQAKLMSG